MGYYTDYINSGLDFQGLEAERKKQLAMISKLRGGRDILVFAADLSKPGRGSMEYSDILPVQDQLATLSGTAIDIIVETPGGLAEVAEDIVKMIRAKYERVGMIVPGWAKSAGTIFVLAGDEILMGSASALGPIDAQILNNKKRFSAHAFLEGLSQIQQEVTKTGRLNAAFIPILQNISPGEIQHCQNAQALSETLVTDYLARYKFKYWEKRATSGAVVTAEYKRQRAASIAKQLSSQSLWLTHNRSIRRDDLERLGLKVTDYSQLPELNDAITRYYTLLRMAFDTNLFKVVETIGAQIYRFSAEAKPAPLGNEPAFLEVDINCGKCKGAIPMQVRFDKATPIDPKRVQFPADNLIVCPHCQTQINIAHIRLQIEGQVGKKIIA